MSESNQIKLKNIIHFFVDTSVGNGVSYRSTVLGQLLIGFLYSFRYFDVNFVGLIIGYILPVIWVISSYRYLKFRAVEVEKLPFPGFLKKDPGNLFVILADIVFLSIIWFLILSGVYDATWLRIIFTMVFPVLTLSMMRTLVIFPKENSDADSN